MAIEYFCISDSDTDMLEQIAQLGSKRLQRRRPELF